MEQEQKITKKYWFKPARFWKYFAFYYPVSMEGWIVTFIFFTTLIRIFIIANNNSHSVSDMLIFSAPWVILSMVAFDFFCRRFGEFPSWWKRWKKGESK